MKQATNHVVNIPNNKVVTSYFKGQIPDSLVLSKKARDAHMFKDIHSTYLICLGKVCDGECTYILD